MYAIKHLNYGFVTESTPFGPEVVTFETESEGWDYLANCGLDMDPDFNIEEINII